MDFSQTWNETKATDRNAPAVPDGTYTAAMVDVKMITAKKDGKEWIVAEFRISNPGGKADGQKLSKFYGFHSDSIGYLKTDLATMGREISAPTSQEDLVQKLYDLCPLGARIAVSSKLDKNGVLRTNFYINEPADSAMDDDQLPF